MVQLSYFYDLRKAEVATESPLTHYIPKPALDVWARAKVLASGLGFKDWLVGLRFSVLRSGCGL